MKIFQAHSLFAAAAAVSMLVAAPAFAAPTVAITGPATATPGGSLQLTVNASDFTDLYAYQFDVTFDPTKFTSTSVTEGGFLSSQGSTFFDGGAVDNANGTVSFIIDSLIGPESGATGSGNLAELTFNVGSNFTGTGSFALSNVVGLDSFLNPIDVTAEGTSVSAVPEPASWGLLLAGLACVAAVKLKRRSGRNATASC
jgi:hypothetical protein